MNETFYALVENGVVTNVMVLYPPSAAEFEGAVPCGDLPVAVGDTYDGEHFYPPRSKNQKIAGAGLKLPG